MRKILSLIVALIICHSPILARPDGFTNELVVGDFAAAVGVRFAADGRALVWEKSGRVWTVTDGVRDANALLDISDEIANYGDYGLVGLAMDPAFLTNGHFYLLYAVDHYHLTEFGDAEYEPTENDYFRATIARLTRYTADPATNFHTVLPSSRTVLIGSGPTTGIPLMAQSHGPGSLVFGRDGTLLISCGDGASSQVVDTGGDSQGTYTVQGLAEGILRAKENIGAYRAQLIDSMCGKILRVDPATGNGLPSNPFYDAGNPAAAKSRVWALGFRQPYRMTVKPNTGSTDASLGDPGTIYIGDVGWAVWEELSVVTAGGQNFGWPIYEGLETHPQYSLVSPANPDAPNPLGCATYFGFDDLLIQDTLDPTPSFPNPCDGAQQVPSTIPQFVHRRPILEWNHEIVQSRYGAYDGTSATAELLGVAGASVQGTAFSGSCSTGGSWYTGTLYPAEYQNHYYHGDFVESWIRRVSVDSEDRATEVLSFVDAQNVVSITENPVDGMLYFISYTNELRRVAYAPCGNQPPVAVIDVDSFFGVSPLSVQFGAADSFDADAEPLVYSWDFGDGTTSTLSAPSHTFTAAPGTPTRFDVALTVTDPFGASHTTTQLISVNNTPPTVTITSPLDGELYSVTGDMVFACNAIVDDAEHDASELTCQWQTFLHHDTHNHPEAIDTECSTTTTTSPVGCGGEVYFFRVMLTVTDAAGLSTTQEVTLLPDCSESPLGVIHSEVHPHEATVVSGDDLEFTIDVGNGGAVDLTNVQVIAACDSLILVGGDDNTNGILETDETWHYTCTVTDITASFTQVVTTSADSPTGVVSDEHSVPVLVVPANARVTTGQIAVYAMDEGSGNTVHDVSGYAPPMDLEIADSTAVSWLPGGGLAVTSPTTILSDGPGGKITERLQVTQEFTVEAWVRPDTTTQSGPARIVALSIDSFPNGANLMLAQSQSDVRFRLRTTQSNEFGLPAVPIPPGTLTDTSVHHVVVTRSICSGTRFYQDGNLVMETPLEGDLAGWDATAQFGLANEPSGNRAWLGDLHLVAVFDRALDADEVSQNFVAGPQGAMVNVPTIDAGPSPLSLCAGDALSLSVAASGDGPFTFQWRRDGVGLVGASDPTYDVIAVSIADAGEYDVVVSNAVGSVVSAPAIVTVDSAPAVVAAPVDQSVCLGASATFTVAVTEAPTSYEWYRDGVSLGLHGTELTIPVVSPADFGEYVVEVSAACGSVTTTAALLLETPAADCVPSDDPLSEDFSSYVAGDQPAGWIDTTTAPSLTVDDGLFAVAEEAGETFLRTTSSQTNIHSHYAGPVPLPVPGYRYSGRLRISDPSGGIGVTAFSQLPGSNGYYRLRRYFDQPLILTAGGTSFTSGNTSTGVVPVANTWYRFALEAEDTGTQTEIRAKVWLDGAAEPGTWQASAVDANPTRWTSGTIGVWSFFNGSKDWDDLAVDPLAPPGPTLTVDLSGLGSGTITRNPDLPQYAVGDAVELTATAAFGSQFAGWSGAVTDVAPVTSVTMTGDLNVVATFELAPGTYYEGFDAPTTDWVDTEAFGSLVVDDTLFSIAQEGADTFLRTISTATNIHSHYDGPSVPGAPGYRYTGRLRMSNNKGGIGVTAFSGFPGNTAYYRLRRYLDNGFHLTASGTTFQGGTTETGVIPNANQWYRFALEVEDTTTQTDVRAKVWPEGAAEPAAWQVSAFDASPTRLTGGTFGVWSFHAGSKDWDDIRAIPLSPPGPTLTVSVAGTGGGTVERNPDQPSYSVGDVVELTAIPDLTSTFTSWSGAASGTSPVTTVTVTEDLEVTAAFDTLPTFALTLTTLGDGTGAVLRDPDQPSYLAGQVVQLTAFANPDSAFDAWGGDASGTEPSTTVTITGDQTVTATFSALPGYVLTTATSGLGSGLIVRNPDLPVYSEGQVVELTAAANFGSVFTGWSGDVTDSVDVITLTMVGDVTLDAAFDPLEGAFENFDNYVAGDNPADWVDTGPFNSLEVDDSLFVVAEEGGETFLRTNSPTTNIHSHYTGADRPTGSGYRYSGRMRISDAAGGIGLTTMSSYPDATGYYRLRRYFDGSFYLTATGTTYQSGTTDTGVVPAANSWYRFAFEVEDTGSTTEIRAKVWLDGTEEPSDWQALAFDNSATRWLDGTFGVWSFYNGNKDWDDLSVTPIATPVSR